MSTKTPDLVCVGHIVREIIRFPDDEKGPFLGGPPAYSSVAAACQGTHTGLVTMIGTDMPQELLKPFSDAVVCTEGIHLQGVTTATELIYDHQGNKEIRYPAKAEPIHAKDIPTLYHGCRLIYVCTMDNDVPLENLSEVTALGRQSAVDLGGYGGVHMSKAHREAIPSLPEYACEVSRHFTIVKASDEDARSIFGKDDPDQSAATLLSTGCKVVVITAGPEGAYVYTPGSRVHVPPVPTQVVDTTGGGDTFMAGFLSEYLRSGNLTASARWGCGTAGLVIQKTGGVLSSRMPSRNEVEEILKQD